VKKPVVSERELVEMECLMVGCGNWISGPRRALMLMLLEVLVPWRSCGPSIVVLRAFVDKGDAVALG